MILLVDIGNTNTHIGLADGRRVRRRVDLPTAGFLDGTAARRLLTFVGRNQLTRAALCSVVPRATPAVRRMFRTMWHLRATEHTPQTLREVGIDYPRPDSIGADRLANAAAAHHHFGAPVVVVDFGTAVTFDVVDRRGNYVGGIIAPGLAAMTDYLHERTALLPRLKIREPGSIIGRSTRQAMLIGAVHGYRGLIRELILRLRHELRTARLPVVATGTYARLLAAKLPEITRVEPYLTLEGLRLIFQQEPAGVSRR